VAVGIQEQEPGSDRLDNRALLSPQEQ
jgi:hypothetical protein